ncbi:MAG TPA: hypothetical protein PLD92_05140 [Candidatus Omnitrophota bacterium]|nr:hypothetical protein [Candidatus Omnitrophota bacterium]
MKRPFYQSIRSIFTEYYVSLEDGVAEARRHPLPPEDLERVQARIQEKWNAFWRVPLLADTPDPEMYLNNVQKTLRAEGYCLDITPQYGLDAGGLNFEIINHISLRPVLERTRRKARAGGQEIEYEEFLLGENLIKVPPFIEPILESASASEVMIFTDDLKESLDNDYALFEDYWEESQRHYQKGLVSADNLCCVTLRLHKRQWGTGRPGPEAQNLLMEHFRRHGEQHVADFNLINTGTLKFSLEDPALTEDLNKDSLLEARVLLQQLLRGSLPYYTLGQIILFEREWLTGSRSEYAWAGHVLFDGLPRGVANGLDNREFWVTGIEDVAEEVICRLALGFARRNRNFTDLLPPGH